MEYIQKAPEWLVKMVPEGGARDFVQGPGWYLILGAIGLVLLLITLRVIRALRAPGGGQQPKQHNLEEDLASYPPLKPSTGDRQLRAEGVPVRIRLVVIAPAGSEAEVHLEDAEELLERILPGLGEICKGDRPRIKIWPPQLSYEGFANHFQRNMLTLEGQGEMSPWVLLAGRAKLGKQQIMLGLGLQAAKPTTIGRRMVDAHEWASVLRVRVRE